MAEAALRNALFVPTQERITPKAEEEKTRIAKNTAYLAEIKRRVANIEAGHWTEHELIEADDA